jgi:hypothetical protein
MAKSFQKRSRLLKEMERAEIGVAMPYTVADNELRAITKILESLIPKNFKK